MRPRLTSAVPFLAALLCAAVAIAPARVVAQRSSEAFLDDDARPNALRVTVEMDPALAFGVGYVRSVPIVIDSFARRLALHGDVTVTLGGSSWDLTGGAAMQLFEGPVGPNLLAAIDLELKVAQNDVHTALVYGYGLALRPGWFDPTWYLAAEASLRGTFAATLLHRAAYRDQAGAEDGTYVTGQLALYLGAAVGFHIERTVTIGFRFAWRMPYTLASYAPWYQPYTVNLELAWRF